MVFCASVGFYAACCGQCFVRCSCLCPAVQYVYLNYLLLIPLQEKIDTVTVEGVENVGEEDCIKIKTEEGYIQLVRTVKSEQEVSVCVGVVCGSDLFTGICVLYCTLYLVTHFFHTYIYIFLFSARESAGSTCVIRCV